LPQEKARQRKKGSSVATGAVKGKGTPVGEKKKKRKKHSLGRKKMGLKNMYEKKKKDKSSLELTYLPGGIRKSVTGSKAGGEKKGFMRKGKLDR